MGYRWVLYRRVFFFSLFLLGAIGSISSLALAASLNLSWQDNSTNENGFKIERKSDGNYAEIASVGPNIQSYADTNVVSGKSYCYRVRSFNSSSVSSPSNESCFTIPIAQPAPALTSLSPSSATAVGPAFTLTVNGSNFVSGSVVQWNGAARSTTFVSATQLTAAIPTSDIATAGTAQVRVVNPGGGTSNALTFTINTTACSVGQFFAQYYNNISLSGTPTFTRCEGVINYNWGSGGPGNSIGNDNFSVRWTGRFNFNAGAYNFTPRADDGIRVWIDGTQIIDGWKDQAATTYQATRTLTAGEHEVKVAYYERGGGAVAQVAWQATATFALGLTKSGTGSGSVTSTPAGITCGTDCSEVYPSATVVSLVASPATGSTFSGWSGDSDCLDGTVTLNTNKSCTATFKLDTATLNVVRTGNGLVSSNPAGINCGTECSKSYAKGTKVTLSAKASANSKFAGWAGGGCQGLGDCAVSLESQTSVNATFLGANLAAIGIFRSSTAEWFLDGNGNGIWEGCNVDLCLGPFGEVGDLPVVGDWTGTGFSNIGVFRPSTAKWFLDLDGNGQWDGCNIDGCLSSVSSQESLPIVGDWTGSGVEMIGQVVSGGTPMWRLDLNGDGLVDCNSDACLKFPSPKGDFPVSGDWNGTGKAKIGTFRPATGEWFLDFNGSGQWGDCKFDKCLKFGTVGDRPSTGDWTGDGRAKVGFYRPATGEWFLDLNGNGTWDGCGTDGCAKFLDKRDGDLPVVGIW